MRAEQPGDPTRSPRCEVPLVEVQRGPLVESRHFGHIVAVDSRGEVIAFSGEPDFVTYLRSSAKLHQAIPLITSGAADRFGFTDREIALACASHSGETIHTEIAASMLRKIGLHPEALKCGVHEPFSAEVTNRLRQSGEEPNVLHNNCSGKHAGMLALARHLGAATESYDHPENPVQQKIAACVAQFAGLKPQELILGVDGCGVPVFGMSLRAMARMYVHLVSPPGEFDSKTIEACARIVKAVMAYPELIGGTVNRLDTELMRAAKGQLVSKVGAEGVYTLGVLPSQSWPNGFGLALKIEDGDDHRARPAVVIEALRQLGILGAESLEALARYRSFPVRNRREEQVGTVKAVFALSHPR